MAEKNKIELPPLWDSIITCKSFFLKYGDEAPEGYSEIRSNPDKYRVMKEAPPHYTAEGVALTIWYRKKIGEIPRPQKAIVKGFKDRNADAARLSGLG